MVAAHNTSEYYLTNYPNIATLSDHYNCVCS